MNMDEYRVKIRREDEEALAAAYAIETELRNKMHQLTRDQLANAIAVIAHLRSQVTEAHRLLREARRFVDDDPCKLTSSALTRQISAALSSTVQTLEVKP